MKRLREKLRRRAMEKNTKFVGRLWECLVTGLLSKESGSIFVISSDLVTCAKAACALAQALNDALCLCTALDVRMCNL